MLWRFNFLGGMKEGADTVKDNFLPPLSHRNIRQDEKIHHHSNANDIVFSFFSTLNFKIKLCFPDLMLA